MELIQKDLGALAKLDLALEGGVLIAKESISIIPIILDWIDKGAASVKATIPGQVDDAIIDLVVSTLKAELAKLGA